MKSNSTRMVRIIVAAVLGLLLAVFLGTAAIFRRPSLPSAAGAAILDNAACQRCHKQAWDEWASSMHARAWRDPAVQASFGTFGFDRKCQSCHAAEPTLAANGAEPILRTADLESGVNCVTCHQLSDGGVAARRSIADAPCRPVESALLVSSASCAVCHIDSHKDWSQSSFALKHQECQTCHMPLLATEGARHSHACLGGHDEATVRSGVRSESVEEGDDIVVRVTNHATGHNFPGERHHRTLMVQMIERSADGSVLLSRQETIKGVTPFRAESSADKIRSGQTVEVRFPIVARPAEAEVTLIYKLFPWYTDREATVLSRERMELSER